MSPAPDPPGFAERALTRALPAGPWRDAILGDLHEEHVALLARRGRGFAAAWYALQALRLGVRYRVRRPRRARARGGAMRDWWAGDLRQALRGIRKRPALAALVVGTLTLGLAANAAVFAIVDALMLRPLEFPGAERLVMFAEPEPGDFFSTQDVAPASFVEWSEGLAGLESPVALEWWSASVRGEPVPEAVQAFRVSAGFFDLLGMPPALGRGFSAEEGRLGAAPVAVLGQALWARRFGADPAVLGREVFVDAQPYTVVGVAPAGFDFPVGAELWVPFALDPEAAARRDITYLTVIGRLAAGSDLDALSAQLAVFDERARREHPEAVGRRQAAVRSLSDGLRDPGAGPFLALWQLSALLVLLIACANVANLLLARGAERQRELAVRQALGAGRGRLLRQMLTESALLGLAAALLALPLAAVAARQLKGSIPASIARFVMGWEHLGVDLGTVGFTLVLALASTAAFGALPALVLSRLQLAPALKDGGRSASEGRARQRGRSALVVAEIALSLALLIASGLAVGTALAMLDGPKGYDPDGVLALAIDLPETVYAEPAQRARFAREALERLSALPGVERVAAANVLPFTGSNSRRSVEIEGAEQHPEQDRYSDSRVVSPSYFETLKVPLLAGRGFSLADDADAEPVAIVSSAFVERYWPGLDPLGRRLRIGADGPWLRVVGVAGDVIHHWFDRRRFPTLYQPFEQAPRGSAAFALRVQGDPESYADAVRAELARIDPERPAYQVRSLRRAVSDTTFGLRVAAVLMSVFAGIALLLAASGVYGVMAYRVSQRTQEFGVRVALGAGARQIIGLTLVQAGRLTALGLAIGLALALLLSRGMVAVFHGALTPQPGIFAGFGLLLGLVALLAGYLPARRALAVDPVRALRSE